MKKITRLILIAVLFYCNTNAWAQVGINQDDPDTLAILDIKHQNKGVLFPRIDDIGQVGEVNGMFFYRTTDNKFYYYNGTSWQCVNPFSSTSGNTIEGNITIQNGGVTVQGGNLTVEPENTINGFGTIPIEGIIMWSGSVANFETSGLGKSGTNMYGWALCNGQNGSPDLRGRFVVGYGLNGDFVGNDLNGNSVWDANYASIGESNKGERTHKLTANESGLRQHNHVVSGNTYTDAAHKHTGRGTKQCEYDAGGAHFARADWDGDPPPEDLGGGAGPVTRTDGAHSHQINITSQNKGPLDAIDYHENRPPYFVIAYIIRVK